MLRLATKKPVTVQTWRWDGTAESGSEIIDWILSQGGTAQFWCNGSDDGKVCRGDSDHVLRIRTLEGSIDASPGDIIIRGVKGEFYPCKPDAFAETYEEIR